MSISFYKLSGIAIRDFDGSIEFTENEIILKSPGGSPTRCGTTFPYSITLSLCKAWDVFPPARCSPFYYLPLYVMNVNWIKGKKRGSQFGQWKIEGEIEVYTPLCASNCRGDENFVIFADEMLIDITRFIDNASIILGDQSGNMIMKLLNGQLSTFIPSALISPCEECDSLLSAKVLQCQNCTTSSQTVPFKEACGDTGQCPPGYYRHGPSGICIPDIFPEPVNASCDSPTIVYIGGQFGYFVSTTSPPSLRIIVPSREESVVSYESRSSFSATDRRNINGCGLYNSAGGNSFSTMLPFATSPATRYGSYIIYEHNNRCNGSISDSYLVFFGDMYEKCPDGTLTPLTDSSIQPLPKPPDASPPPSPPPKSCKLVTATARLSLDGIGFKYSSSVSLSMCLDVSVEFYASLRAAVPTVPDDRAKISITIESFGECSNC